MISVIIVNYNGKKWLSKCLNSLEAQTFHDLEIIVVDNASADDSVSYIQKNHSKVRICKSEINLGFAGGNNLGIKHAHGEYLLLINSDTWVDPKFVEDLWSFYTRGNYDVVAPTFACYDGKLKPQKIHTLDLLGYPTFFRKDGKSRRNNFYMSGACLLFSKKLYKDTGGLDNDFFMYFEETDWFWRLNMFRTYAFA